MSIAKGIRIIGCLCALVGASGGMLSAQEQAEPRVRIPTDLIAPEHFFDYQLLRRAFGGEQEEEFTPGVYWIGIACSPGAVSETARTHLGLKEKEGLAVSSVIADSPAEKAGFKPHDILLKAGEATIGSFKDLRDAVEKAEDKELSVELLRAGKKMTLKVTPVKRSDAQAAVRSLPLRGWSLVQPGMIMRKWEELPNNVSISIHKQGKQPAKITVERDGKKWETTEDKLQELPEDVRPMVEQMLGGRTAFSIQHGPLGEHDGRLFDRFRLTQPPVATPVVPLDQLPGNQQRQLDQIQRQLRELHQKLKDLEEAQPLRKRIEKRLKGDDSKSDKPDEKSSEEKEKSA